MLIKPGQIKKTETLVEEDNLREKIKKVQKKDKKVVRAVEKLKKTEMKTLKNKEQTIEKGLVIKKEQIYIPEEELKRRVIYLYYNMLVEGHRRKQKTTKLVMRNYWWLGVTKEMKRYVEGYNAC